MCYVKKWQQNLKEGEMNMEIKIKDTMYHRVVKLSLKSENMK